MRPFNLKEAQIGESVCTRSGRDVRIISYDRYDENNEYPIVALIKFTREEKVGFYSLDGKYKCVRISDKDDMDLVMKPIHYEGWVIIRPYIGNIAKIYYVEDEGIFGSKEEAEKYINKNDSNVQIVKIEWED